jgi:hypothetical protein
MMAHFPIPKMADPENQHQMAKGLCVVPVVGYVPSCCGTQYKETHCGVVWRFQYNLALFQIRNTVTMITGNHTMKKAIFRGNSLDDIRSFPEAAKKDAGYAIDDLQHGDAKRLQTDAGCWFRGLRNQGQCPAQQRPIPGFLHRQIWGRSLHSARLPIRRRKKLLAAIWKPDVGSTKH